MRVWAQILTRPVLRVVFGIAVAVAFWIQIVGACYYRPLESINWDASPANVDLNHKRLWDWRDTTISRSWHSERPEPLLYFEAWYLLQSNGEQEHARN